MPIQQIFNPPNLPLVEITTELTGSSYVDEYGETVPEERVTSILVNNQTPSRWVVTIYRNGNEVFSGNVAAGFNERFNIPGNRRFIFNTYSASISRQ